MPDDPRPPELVVDHVEHAGSITRVTRVKARGGTNSPSFVLVAGVGVAATYFEFLAPSLALRGDVYALDLPGFAGMPRPDAEPTAAFFADQVEAVLDHFGLDDPVLVGHSMGTQVVTEVLARRPDLTHAVLVSPVINEAEAGVGTQALRFTQSATHESLHLAMTVLSAYLLCGVVYFVTVLPYMLRYRITDRIRHTRAHVLFIRGEHDRNSPRRFHSRLVAAAANASRWEIEDAAHSVINGHAIGVARLTLSHIDGTLARRGRMPASAAEMPPPGQTDLTMVLGALGSRAREWVSALRQDERGVARAKLSHAQILWRAYSGSDRSRRPAIGRTGRR